MFQAVLGICKDVLLNRYFLVHMKVFEVVFGVFMAGQRGEEREVPELPRDRRRLHVGTCSPGSSELGQDRRGATK